MICKDTGKIKIGKSEYVLDITIYVWAIGQDSDTLRPHVGYKIDGQPMSDNATIGDISKYYKGNYVYTITVKDIYPALFIPTRAYAVFNICQQTLSCMPIVDFETR